MPNTIFKPEDYGAVGDASTNDSSAFAQLSAAVQAAGGGVIELRPRAIYMVGGQTFAGRQGAGWAYTPDPIINLNNLQKAVRIIGNGAVLKCRAGLKYGSFDPVTGAAYNPQLPFKNDDYRASPYVAMIQVTGCSKAIRIEDVELDGSAGSYVLGGQWGDTGYQIPACGLIVIDNEAELLVSNVYCHDHGQDGVEFRIQATENNVRVPQTFINVRCDQNARQGWSIIGGRGITLMGCTGNRTGRGKFMSAPGAGIDIEAERTIIRDLVLLNCEFSDNAGNAVVADLGDSADILIKRSKLVGTTAPTIFCRKPRFVVEDTTIVGASVLGFASNRYSVDCHRYVRCLFTDDPALSPTGTVYNGPIFDMGASTFHTTFSDCDFRLVGQSWAPYSNNDAHYHNVRMVQTSGTVAYPRGSYTGENYLNGAINATDTVPRNGGKLFYANGSRNYFLREAQVAAGALSVPAGGRSEVPVTTLFGVDVNDIVTITSNMDIGLLDCRCLVTGLNTAKLIYTNYTAAAINKPAETVSLKAVDRLG